MANRNPDHDLYINDRGPYFDSLIVTASTARNVSHSPVYHSIWRPGAFEALELTQEELNKKVKLNLVFNQKNKGRNPKK